MLRLYLYLASRSKNGIKLVTVLQSETSVNTDVTDLKSLSLPDVWQNKIARIIYDNRMLYQPRMETAKDFNELRTRLKGRGYDNLPMGACPLLHLQAYRKAPIANIGSCKVVRTMLRKPKS